MEHIAALLLIIGCSDNLGECRELPAPVPVFEALEDCESGLQPSVDLFTKEHARVFARCVEVDPALEEQDAELVWDIKPDGTLEASIEIPEVVVASNPERREKDYLSQE